MAYKIKSMLKQTSGTGLSANYYLKQELNKFTDGDLEVTNPSNEGESIAKVTKKFTPFEILKSKGSAIKRDEKKQIRKAGREAAKNAEVDFVKATPMGSDYFSLMAATAENLASRGAGKRKARKEAKDLKRKDLREVKPIESKGVEEINQDKSNDTRVPKEATEVVPFNRTYEEPKKETKKETKNNMNTKFIENITRFPQTLTNGYIIPRGEGNKKTVTPQGDKNTENLDSKYFYSDGTPRYSVGINRNTGKEYLKRNLSPASKAVNKTITDAIGSISSIFTNPFSSEAVAERKTKLEQARQKNQQRQEEAKLNLEKIKQIQGLPMMGDGFNKGMSRKNKYKK